MLVVVAVVLLGALGWVFSCAILQVTRLPFLPWNGGSVTARRWVAGLAPGRLSFRYPSMLDTPAESVN